MKDEVTNGAVVGDDCNENINVKLYCNSSTESTTKTNWKEDEDVGDLECHSSILIPPSSSSMSLVCKDYTDMENVRATHSSHLPEENECIEKSKDNVLDDNHNCSNNHPNSCGTLTMTTTNPCDLDGPAVLSANHVNSTATENILMMNTRVSQQKSPMSLEIQQQQKQQQFQQQQKFEQQQMNEQRLRQKLTDEVVVDTTVPREDRDFDKSSARSYINGTKLPLPRSVYGGKSPARPSASTARRKSAPTPQLPSLLRSSSYNTTNSYSKIVPGGSNTHRGVLLRGGSGIGGGSFGGNSSSNIGKNFTIPIQRQQTQTQPYSHGLLKSPKQHNQQARRQQQQQKLYHLNALSDTNGTGRLKDNYVSPTTSQNVVNHHSWKTTVIKNNDTIEDSNIKIQTNAHNSKSNLGIMCDDSLPEAPSPEKPLSEENEVPSTVLMERISDLEWKLATLTRLLQTSLLQQKRQQSQQQQNIPSPADTELTNHEYHADAGSPFYKRHVMMHHHRQQISNGQYPGGSLSSRQTTLSLQRQVQQALRTNSNRHLQQNGDDDHSCSNHEFKDVKYNNVDQVASPMMMMRMMEHRQHYDSDTNHEDDLDAQELKHQHQQTKEQLHQIPLFHQYDEDDDDDDDNNFDDDNDDPMTVMMMHRNCINSSQWTHEHQYQQQQQYQAQQSNLNTSQHESHHHRKNLSLLLLYGGNEMEYEQERLHENNLLLASMTVAERRWLGPKIYNSVIRPSLSTPSTPPAATPVIVTAPITMMDQPNYNSIDHTTYDCDNKVDQPQQEQSHLKIIQKTQTTTSPIIADDKGEYNSRNCEPNILDNQELGSTWTKNPASSKIHKEKPILSEPLHPLQRNIESSKHQQHEFQQDADNHENRQTTDITSSTAQSQHVETSSSLLLPIHHDDSLTRSTRKNHDAETLQQYPSTAQQSMDQKPIPRTLSLTQLFQAPLGQHDDDYNKIENNNNKCSNDANAADTKGIFVKNNDADIKCSPMNHYSTDKDSPSKTVNDQIERSNKNSSSLDEDKIGQDFFTCNTRTSKNRMNTFSPIKMKQYNALSTASPPTVGMSKPSSSDKINQLDSNDITLSTAKAKKITNEPSTGNPTSSSFSNTIINDNDIVRSKWLEYLNSFQESTPDVDVQMEEFIKVPGRVETVLGFGFFICIDSFLYMCTILPIRFVWNCFLLVLHAVQWIFSTMSSTILLLKGAQRRRSRGQQYHQHHYHRSILTPYPHLRFHRQHTYQIIQVLIIYTVYQYVLCRISIGKMYHWIRGQSMIKIYVIIAMVEIFDRLFSALGQDCLDSMYWNTVSRPRSIRMLISVVVVVVYVTLHTLILFVHISTLNVAMNSADQALLTILISGNFAEIKSTVFKKYNKAALFKITAGDICERFKLALFLLLILLLNISQGMDHAQYMDYGRICLIVWMAELVADWIKHSFITKFNYLPSSVYPEYALILAGDVTGFGHEHIHLDHSHAVVKRLGFSQIPLIAVMFRLVKEAYKYASQTNPFLRQWLIHLNEIKKEAVQHQQRILMLINEQKNNINNYAGVEKTLIIGKGFLGYSNIKDKLYNVGHGMLGIAGRLFGSSNNYHQVYLKLVGHALSIRVVVLEAGFYIGIWFILLLIKLMLGSSLQFISRRKLQYAPELSSTMKSSTSSSSCLKGTSTTIVSSRVSNDVTKQQQQKTKINHSMQGNNSNKIKTT